jgi:hypothetical protein
MLKETVKGAVIVGMVASMFAGGAALANKGGDKAEGKSVKCAGVNECKGKGACAGANNACAGKNECKGKGVVSLAEKDCKAKGGTVAK